MRYFIYGFYDAVRIAIRFCEQVYITHNTDILLPTFELQLDYSEELILQTIWQYLMMQYDLVHLKYCNGHLQTILFELDCLKRH